MNLGEKNTSGTLSSAPNGWISNHIFAYVSGILTDFEGTPDDNENAITNRFCIILNQRKPSEYPYFFHHQNIEDETQNTSTDFAVFGTSQMNNILSSSALVKFEAKRLSTTLPRSREREYAIGIYEDGQRTSNSGGIERFKNERHGQDVKIAGIIGYVQSDSFDYWFENVNKWIQEEIHTPHDPRLVWTNGDKLMAISQTGKIFIGESESRRISQSNIRFRHIWVNFT